MSAVRSIGSLFWGFILIAAGGLLLAHNLGYAIPVWNGVARYWPVILILWGAFKLVDYFRFKRSGTDRPLFSAGEVVVLILVIFAGSAITIAANLSPNIDDIFHAANIDIWDITGNSYEYAEHHELEARSGSPIDLVNRYGDVDVKPSETDRISIDVKKTVLASDRAEADRLAQAFNFDIKEDGSGYRVVGSFSGTQESRNLRRVRTSLTVRVPKHSMLRIDNRNGGVNVSGLTGNQSITNSFAATVVQDVEGKVDIQNRNGSVEVRGLKGNATIKNAFANIEARNISGSLEIENRNGNVDIMQVGGSIKVGNAFAGTTAKDIGGDLEINSRNGSIDIESVKGNATISNSFASIRTANVQRDVHISGRNGNIEIEHAGGDISVESSFGNVDIRDARGSVTASHRNGDVRLHLDQPPVKDISVTAEFGNVTLDLPRASSFSVDARTRFGQVHSSFDGVNTTSTDRERALNGRVGQGGPNVKVDMRNGNLTLASF